MARVLVTDYSIGSDERSVTLTGLSSVDKNKITSISDASGRVYYLPADAPLVLLEGKTLTLPRGVRFRSKDLRIFYDQDRPGGTVTPPEKEARVFYVDDYGSDPTGATSSDAAVSAAITALGTAPGVVAFGAGKYLQNSTKTLGRAGQYFKSPGKGVTTIDYRGTGPAFSVWDSTVNTNGLVAPGIGGGWIGGVTIDGHLNTNNDSGGFQLGDLIGASVDDMEISGFTRTGSFGYRAQNRYSWTEFGRFRVRVVNCTNCFIVEGHPQHPFPAAIGSKTSFSYNLFDFMFSAETKQNGVVVRNNANCTGINWFMNFNCNPGAANTAAAVVIGKDDADDCRLEGFFAWLGEATVPGAVAHYDLNVGANSRLRGHGSLVFHDYANVPWRPGTASPYRVVFAGRVNSPSLGHYSEKEIPFVTIGDPGRLGALGDDANYIEIKEGDNGTYPTVDARGPSTDIGINFTPKGAARVTWGWDPLVRTTDTAPTAWNSPGKKGMIYISDEHLYVCWQDNMWKRMTLNGF